MTDEQKDALERVKDFVKKYEHHAALTISTPDLRALIDTLAEPRLPKEASEEAIAAMFEGYRAAKYGERFAPAMYRALYAHQLAEQSKPATKEVEISLWVQLDERGKVIHCGPLGESCGASFEMKQEVPKPLSGNSIVFKGKATVPK